MIDIKILIAALKYIIPVGFNTTILKPVPTIYQNTISV